MKSYAFYVLVFFDLILFAFTIFNWNFTLIFTCFVFTLMLGKASKNIPAPKILEKYKTVNLKK